MRFFDQNKALIITVLLLSFLLLLMYNIRLSNSSNEIHETLLNLESLETKELQEEEDQDQEPESEPEENQTAPTEPSVRTHQAYNQNQQENQKNFQERLDEIFEKNSAERTSSEEEIDNADGSVTLNKSKRKKAQKQSDGNNSSENISTQQGSLRNSSISFSLVGRTAVDIPNPIYTCDTSGKIVVNITVNEEGAVTGTSINKSSSTSTNKCLIENALDYAAEAFFSRLNGRNAQKGTITYYFQDQ